MASPDPVTYHPGELDLLIGDLAEAGFRPEGGDRHRWRGPVCPSMARLTHAPSMVIEVRDGWPYLHPYLFVDGLEGRRHVNAHGNVCLWAEDDDRYGGWTRLAPILDRIDAWVADQEAGVAEPALDAHLYARYSSERMLRIDVGDLVRQRLVVQRPGSSGLLRASLSRNVYDVGVAGNLAAVWVWLDDPAAPPTEPHRIRDLLSRGQTQTFDSALRELRRSRAVPVVLLWEDAGQLNAFGAEITRSSPGSYTARSVEVARTDASVLRLRSGPDAAILAGSTVSVFGLGAIGSEIAVLLARSGVGELVLVDHERLRPANLTRHAASGRTVGMRKASAMATTIAEALPCTRVVPFDIAIWHPDRLLQLAAHSALFVDATGNPAYRDLLSRIAADAGVPLVAAALHRGGRIARVRIQASGAMPLWSRVSDPAFPEVPPDPERRVALLWETGCGAPVNNAPPVAVASAGALAARCAVDLLAGRVVRDRDVLDVYEPIPEAPFDRLGPLVFERP